MASDNSDRAVLITGCSSGIGACVAAGLKARGYRVFASARKESDVTRLGEQGFEAMRLDLRDTASIHEALDTVLARTGGKLYGLFNNGGYGQPGAVEDLGTDVLRAQFDAVDGRRALPVGCVVPLRLRVVAEAPTQCGVGLVANSASSRPANAFMRFSS